MFTENGLSLMLVVFTLCFFILVAMVANIVLYYPITPLNGACTVMQIFKDLGIQK